MADYDKSNIHACLKARHADFIITGDVTFVIFRLITNLSQVHGLNVSYENRPLLS